MSIVWKHFFRQMNQRKVTSVKENRIFSCNMHQKFSLSLLNQMKKSCNACGYFLKTKMILIGFCATGLLGGNYFLHSKTPKKCNLIQEIINNSWTDGNFVLFYSNGRRNSSACKSTRHPSFIVYYNPKNPNSTYPLQFLAIHPNFIIQRSAYCRLSGVVNTFSSIFALFGQTKGTNEFEQDQKILKI